MNKCCTSRGKVGRNRHQEVKARQKLKMPCHQTHTFKRDWCRGEIRAKVANTRPFRKGPNLEKPPQLTFKSTMMGRSKKWHKKRIIVLSNPLKTTDLQILNFNGQIITKVAEVDLVAAKKHLLIWIDIPVHKRLDQLVKTLPNMVWLACRILLNRSRSRHSLWRMPVARI